MRGRRGTAGDGSDWSGFVNDAFRIGRRPESRRQVWVKLLWTSIWLAFLGAPVSDLFDGGHAAGAAAGAGLGLVVFVGLYLALLFRHTGKPFGWRVVQLLLAGEFVLAVVLCLTMGTPWLVLFVYVSVTAGAVLPLSRVAFTVPVNVGVMLLLSLRSHDAEQLFGSLVVPTLLGGFSMAGVGQLIRTTVELREARATVAALAANEERLRMARDLHDLLGHSLSLITLKSELAGRMLPDHPEQAAEQVRDINRVGREALADVREAVSGYRRPTLAGELASARTTLAAAGIAADVPADVPAEALVGPATDGREGETEAALAWSLKEAVTNVVRHSGAAHCAVRLAQRHTLDGPVLELTVADDGNGGDGGPRGNGLTGLAERLAAAGGSLDAASTRAGFTLTARAPLSPPASRV